MYVACSIKQMFVFAFWWKPGIYAFLSIPSCNVCFTFELLSYIINIVTPYNSSINKDLCIQETKNKKKKNYQKKLSESGPLKFLPRIIFVVITSEPQKDKVLSETLVSPF